MIQCFTQFRLDLEKAVCRAQPFDPLMRSAEVIVLDPLVDTATRFVIAAELRTIQKLCPDRLPEPLDLTQRLRMVWLAAEVVNAVLLELLLEPRCASPVGELPAVIGEHFLWHTVFRRRSPVDLQHIFGSLTGVQFQPRDEARVVVDVTNQIGVASRQSKAEYIHLPHLVRRCALEKTRLLRVPPCLLARLLDQLLFM